MSENSTKLNFSSGEEIKVTYTGQNLEKIFDKSPLLTDDFLKDIDDKYIHGMLVLKTDEIHVCRLLSDTDDDKIEATDDFGVTVIKAFNKVLELHNKPLTIESFKNAYFSMSVFTLVSSDRFDQIFTINPHKLEMGYIDINFKYFSVTHKNITKVGYDETTQI